ncbi:glycosyltransferase family protein [Emticicia sp.]|uniref:glycosyltransferase family protein n=1 Tax=Emticicia sp. TaxID=1930953 RepID=UPI0037526C6F
MKYLFIIQGEGRGHLTQAIALAEMLESKQHEVVGALVGSADGKNAPKFFTDNFKKITISFRSPCLTYCKETKALDIRKTLSNSILNISKYIHSLRKIQDTINDLRPDIIINFYDILGGIHQFLFRPKVPMVCVAHQYLLLHQDFEHPKNHWFDKFLVNTNTRITALGAAKKIALSFTPFSNDKKRGIFVAPPLLRSEIHALKTTREDYILAYVTQHSLAEELVKWHAKNSKVKVHCFWEKPQNTEVYKYSRNLHFHKINAKKFLEMMQNCKGLVTTAGFESVCEAMYLGKPTLMIPVPKHYEQSCNALDAKRAGAGITGTKFDLSNFINYLPHYQDIRPDFQAWQGQVSRVFLREIDDVFYVNEPIYEDVFPQLSLVNA